ncbi:PilN domain-containing protein [Zobellella maritima]|uniref:PilN domain-containing protein n=1 Tax=Zobellella maritima TaxID=2059725 RepID=UPI000E2FFB60|nr:PilN domain-containing protein [Zobellella maritima]
MSNINLLPWRDAVRAQQKKQFWLILAISALCALTLMVGINLWIIKLIDKQQARNQFLQNETVKLDVVLGQINLIKTQREQILERMQLIAGLQQRRNLSVRLFNEMPELVPPGVYLSSLKVEQERIDVVGKTEAYNRVASMIRQIEDSDWLADPMISTIFASDTQPMILNQFSMLFQMADNRQEVAE